MAATAILPAANAGQGDDAKLFRLLAEEERLWNLHSRVDDEEMRRKTAILAVQVEIGRQTVGGETTPIFAAEEEAVARLFNDLAVPNVLAAVGVQCELYHDRRDELVAQIREQAAAREAALRAAGLDEIEKKMAAVRERARPISDAIDEITPRTIEGAIRLLQEGSVEREEQALAGLRAIARRTGA